MGGEGGAFGAFIGAALIEVIRNSLLMAGVDSNWQGTFVGVFIILAVLLERIRGKTRGLSGSAREPHGQRNGRITQMKKLLIGTAAAAAVARSAFGGGAGAGQEVHLRARAEEHEQPVLRPGPRRLQEGREGARRRKFECVYIGPGEHGGGEEQVQIVHDLIAKKVDGIAVSPVQRRRHGQGARRRPRRPASRS